VAFGKESLCGAHNKALFFLGHAEFRQSRCIFFYRARSHFNKRQGLAVVADQIQFAFDPARRVVLCHKHVAVAPQLPIGVSLSAHARAAHFQLSSASSFVLPRIAGEGLFFAQASPRRPAHRLKHQSRKDWHIPD
jgi:hypothetical protein